MIYSDLDFMPDPVSLRRAYNRMVELLEEEGEEIPDYEDWAEENL